MQIWINKWFVKKQTCKRNSFETSLHAATAIVFDFWIGRMLEDQAIIKSKFEVALLRSTYVFMFAFKVSQMLTESNIDCNDLV